MNDIRSALGALLATCVLAACGSGSGGDSAPAPASGNPPQGGSPGADAQPPIVPSNLAATALSSARVRLTWAASSDNVGVAGYRVYRNGTLVGSATGLSFDDAGLSAASPYEYRVAAFDAAQNVSALSDASSATTAAAGGSDGGLLLAGDLEYLGAFRLPGGRFGCSDDSCGFAYGGGAISYNPQNHSLFIGAQRRRAKIAEVNIPALVNSSDPAALNVATVRQNPTDLALGQITGVGAGGATVSNGVNAAGTLLEGSRLLVSASAYYDAGYQAVNTHFAANAQWGDGTPSAVGYSGMLRVAPDAPQAGFVSGYMGRIPDRWQARLGGTALTGQACIPIISRTSLGPSVFAFNAAQVGVVNPTPASALVHYPSGHWTLGAYETQNPNANQATEINGVVFPEGTRSVLFFGRHGTGPTCYGAGTDDPNLHGQFATDGSRYCYDPTDSAKGTHAYPYTMQVWAYDAAVLATVKDGTRQPWEALPYAVWTFSLPIQGASRRLGGAAYDAATQTLYVSAADAYRDGSSPMPVIHALRVRPPPP